MELKNKTTYTALDLGKFLCALLILFYHYFSEHGPIPRLLDEALSLYAVGVALFMVISGFLTFDKLNGISDFTQRRGYVFKQIKRILTIYLLWSIPYLIYTICNWNFANLTVIFVLKQIRGWIFSSTFYTIWFMPSLAFGLLLAFYLSEKLTEWLTATASIVLFLIGTFTLTYSFIGEKLPFYDNFSYVFNTYLGGSRGWLVFGTPFVMLGKYMVKIKSKIKCIPCMFLSVMSLLLLLAEALVLRKFVGHTGIDTAFMMIPTVFFILGFLLTFKLPSGAYSVWMRKMSVLIFVTQRIFLTVIPHLISTSAYNFVFSNVYIGALFICGGTILFSALIIFASKRIKILKYLF